MRSLSVIAWLSACVGLSPLSLPAQTQVGDIGWWRTCATGTPSNVAYRRVAAGNLTGHGYADVAYLAGNQVMLATAPAIHSAVLPIAPSCVALDVAAVAGGGVAGRDGLAIATASGLYLWRREGISLLDGRDWGSVAVGDLDGNGVVDVFGRNASGSQLQIVLRSASTVTTSSMSFGTEVVREAVAVQWNGTGGSELAIVTDAGVRVREFATLTDLALYRRANQESIGLAPLRMNSGAAVAWLARWANNAVMLAVMQPGAATETLDVGSLSPCSMTAGDWNGDAFDDAVIGRATTSSVAILTNQRAQAGATSTFALSAVTALQHQVATLVGNTASAWVGDFDGDGLCDAVMPRADLGGIVALRRGDYSNANVPITETFPTLDAISDGANVTWHLAVANTNCPVGATHLELIGFATNPGPYGPQASAATLTLQPNAVLRKTIALPAVISPQSVFSWHEPLASATYTFKLAVVRYRNATRVWPPSLFHYAYVGPGSLDGISWMYGWNGAASTWTHNGAQMISTVQCAGTSGTIKPPPPPPPPSPPEPPTPPDSDTGG